MLVTMIGAGVSAGSDDSTVAAPDDAAVTAEDDAAVTAEDDAAVTAEDDASAEAVVATADSAAAADVAAEAAACCFPCVPPVLPHAAVTNVTAARITAAYVLFFIPASLDSLVRMIRTAMADIIISACMP